MNIMTLRNGRNCSLAHDLANTGVEKETLAAPPYYSAEFSISGLGTAYQFKIWNMDATPMCVLVRQDSDILPWLKVGHTFNVKYYSADSAYVPECLQTEIRDITKDDQGRFKGHYLVGLEIRDEQ